jgi:hypothetical protein
MPASPPSCPESPLPELDDVVPLELEVAPELELVTPELDVPELDPEAVVSAPVSPPPSSPPPELLLLLQLWTENAAHERPTRPTPTNHLRFIPRAPSVDWRDPRTGLG